MNMADQIEKLQALRAQGALSEEEFTQAKKRVIEGAAVDGEARAADNAAQFQAAPTALQSLRRSRTDRWFGGVCGGLGVKSGIPTWTWRILFVLSLFLHGLGLLVYVLLWIFVPLETLARAEPVAAPSSTPGTP